MSTSNSYRFNETQKFSIHLPDYINKNQLIDPFSKLPTMGTFLPVFSVIGESKSDFYQKIAALVERYSSKDIFISPQWLPPVAWYFGAQ